MHYQVVKYIRKYHPGAVLMPGLGENQDSKGKRIHSWKKGYVGGQPDIIIQNLHKRYNDLAIELKNLDGSGELPNEQKTYLETSRDNNY